MAQNFKYDRISEEIKKELNNIIETKIESISFVSVIDVKITKDLADAIVYIQCLEENKKYKYLKILEEKKNFIKKNLSQKVKIRKTPNLIFKYDDSLDNYNNIDKILNDLEK